jgi:hypothetical protein
MLSGDPTHPSVRAFAGGSEQRSEATNQKAIYQFLAILNVFHRIIAIG